MRPRGKGGGTDWREGGVDGGGHHLPRRPRSNTMGATRTVPPMTRKLEEVAQRLKARYQVDLTGVDVGEIVRDFQAMKSASLDRSTFVEVMQRLGVQDQVR